MLVKLEDFPAEIHAYMYLSFLPEKINVLCGLNKAFFKLIRENQLLWRLKLEQHFPDHFPSIKIVFEELYLDKKNPPPVDYWYVKFWETYQSEYTAYNSTEKLPALVCQLFSMAKQGRLNGLKFLPVLFNAAEFSSFFCYREKSGRCVLDWVGEKNDPHNWYFKKIFANQTNNSWHNLPDDLSSISVLHKYISDEEKESGVIVVCCQPNMQRINDIDAAGDNWFAIGQRSITPLRLAAWRGDFEFADALLKLGAWPDGIPYSTTSPLVLSAERGHVEVVEFLWEKATLPNQPKQINLFYQAINKKYFALAHFLSQKISFDPNEVRVEPVEKTWLQLAVDSGNVTWVEFFLKKGADVEGVCDKNKRTPLYMAAKAGNLAIVNLLIAWNASVDTCCGNDNETALYAAARKGHVVVFERLLEEGANLHPPRTRMPVFFVAALKGQVDIINILLEGKKIDTNERIQGISAAQMAILGDRPEKTFNALISYGAEFTFADTVVFFADKGNKAYRQTLKALFVEVIKRFSANDVLESGETALHLAACFGDAESIDRLLEQGCHINASARGREGKTPLHLAIEHNNQEAMRALLKYKEIDLNVCDSKGKTPLHCAITSRCSISGLGLLLDQDKIDLTYADENGDTFLHFAARLGCVTALRHLISSKKFDVTLKNQQGDTAFHVLINECHDVNEMESLLMGAEINAINNAGETLLYLAVLKQCHRVEILLKAGANPNIHEKGKVPLLVACKYVDHYGIVKAFLQAGADPNAVALTGESALHIAVENAAEMTVDLLLKKGADINVTDALGRTPLYLAITHNFSYQHQQMSMIKFFLSQKDINQGCKNGETAFCAALRKKNIDVMSVLVQRGANVISHIPSQTPDYEKLTDLLVVFQFIVNPPRHNRNSEDKNLLTFFKDPELFVSDFLFDEHKQYSAAIELFEALFKDEDIRLLSNRALKWGELGKIYDALVAKKYPSSFSLVKKDLS